MNGEIGQIIGVLNIDSSTRWWREIERVATDYCFLHERIKFIDANGDSGLLETKSNNRPQFFFYAGSNAEAFKSGFSQYGLVLKK